MSVMNPEISDLPPRRLAVLRMICEGARTQDIADELGLSYGTIRAYRQLILDTFGTNMARVCYLAGLARLLETTPRKN